jgi:hypothetical protein
MQAQQIIHSANLTNEERHFEFKQNQNKLIAEQAETCADSCLQLDLASLQQPAE